MSTPTERISKLMNSLPTRDIDLGYKFLTNRDFDSLKELVDSAVYKVQKNQRSERCKEEYKKVDLSTLNQLRSEVNSYIVLLDISMIGIEDPYETIEEYEPNEDFY